MPLRRELVEQIDKALIDSAVVLAEAGDRAAEVGAVEFGLSADLTREKTFAQRAEGHEADPEFLERLHHGVFRLPPPQRVLALKRGDGLNRMRATDGLFAGLRETEVLHLALLDQVLHRARDVFDRDVR